MQVILSDGIIGFITGKWDSPEIMPFDRRMELLARYLGVKAEIREGKVIFELYYRDRDGLADKKATYTPHHHNHMIFDGQFMADSLWTDTPGIDEDDVVPGNTPLEQKVIQLVKDVITGNGYIFNGYKTLPTDTY